MTELQSEVKYLTREQHSRQRTQHGPKPRGGKGVAGCRWVRLLREGQCGGWGEGDRWGQACKVQHSVGRRQELQAKVRHRPVCTEDSSDGNVKTVAKRTGREPVRRRQQESRAR